MLTKFLRTICKLLFQRGLQNHVRFLRWNFFQKLFTAFSLWKRLLTREVWQTCRFSLMWSSIYVLSHVMSLVSFYTAWEIQKTSGSKKYVNAIFFALLLLLLILSDCLYCQYSLQRHIQNPDKYLRRSVLLHLRCLRRVLNTPLI